MLSAPCSLFVLFIRAAPSVIYTLSLHDALPISAEVGDDDVDGDAGVLRCPLVRELRDRVLAVLVDPDRQRRPGCPRSEEHTSELQSLRHLVCRLLLEKKKQ